MSALLGSAVGRTVFHVESSTASEHVQLLFVKVLGIHLDAKS
jgi:hypothetical protein